MCQVNTGKEVFATGKHCSYGVWSSVFKARFCGGGFVDRFEHPVLSVFCVSQVFSFGA